MGNIIFMMGVSGCGKTTIGKALAHELQLPFLEGDSFHPQKNIAKMASGQALNDADRKPWLQKINAAVKEKLSTGCVVSCSALKISYRNILAELLPPERIHWIYLKGSHALTLERLQARKGHFMPSSLLQSQMDLLEETSSLTAISIAQTPTAIVEEIVKTLAYVKS